MTKLERKLCELGYVISHSYVSWDNEKCYYKDYGDLTLRITTDLEMGGWITPYYKQFSTQQEIDRLQQAFNQLQKDLKELKEC